ncbi:MAG: alpha/beta fold hydrolase [Cyanobacteria bacterium P01_E01_bin.42]
MARKVRGFWWRILQVLIASILLGYSAIALLLFFYQRRFIFNPMSAMELTPKDLNLTAYEEVWIPVENRGEIEHLHGWFLPSNDSPWGTLLYLHGKGGNISTNIRQAHYFQKLGFSVLLFDYRGYGRSEGKFPSERRVYGDAEAAWNYLRERHNIPPDRIFIYGHSLGGAIAIELATKQPDAAGLIVQNSFTSLVDMSKRLTHFRIFPVNILLRDRFDSIAKVTDLQMPVLYIHGAEDDYVPPQMSRTLYERSPQPKSFFLVPRAGHNNGNLFYDNPNYGQEIRQFIQEVKR